MSLDQFSSPNLFSSLLDTTVQQNPVYSPPETSLNSSSSSLFSSLLNTTIQPNPEPLPPNPHPHPQSLRDSLVAVVDDDIDTCAVSTPSLPSLLSSPQPPFSLLSPLVSSTPKNGPATQELVDRMLELRHVDGEDSNMAVRRENEELKSEVAALQIQLAEYEKELERLRQPLPPPSQPGQQQLESDLEGFTSVISKKKKKIKSTINQQPEQPPQQQQQQCQQQPQQFQQQQQTSRPNLFVYHDSNLKGATAKDLTTLINNINKNSTPTTPYNIILENTFTLPQTLAKIKHTTYKNNDKVILNIMTNDARQTKHRPRRTPDRTKQLQTAIIQQLVTHIPHNNITILESPPLLDSPSSDIFAYNNNSFSLAQQLGVRFAGTLNGEQHLWTDGYHVLNKFRPLLLKSVAEAAVGINPRQHFGLSWPPYGQFGPWVGPKGRGIMPTFRDLALAQPFSFRRLGPIHPLMNNPVRRP